jgi:hypothetical protein
MVLVDVVDMGTVFFEYLGLDGAVKGVTRSIDFELYECAVLCRGGSGRMLLAGVNGNE